MSFSDMSCVHPGHINNAYELRTENYLSDVFMCYGDMIMVIIFQYL